MDLVLELADVGKLAAFAAAEDAGAPELGELADELGAAVVAWTPSAVSRPTRGTSQ